MEQRILKSPEWGEIRLYVAYSPKREKWEYTLFAPFPRLKYKFFYDENGWKNEDGTPKEVEFENFLIGGRSFRFDLEFDKEMSEEELLSEVEIELQDMFDNDELYGFHVEKLDDTALIEKLDQLGSDELCSIMDKAHKDRIYYAKKRLENEHMEVLCMQVGEKFGWDY